MRLTFLGATGTVTGSKYLIEYRNRRILIDCGLFQGLKQLRQRNWQPLPVPPSSIDAVVLTHAHLDHSGYVPLLVRDGFRGPVYCTPPTMDLCAVLLPDSGRLQEEEADTANRYGYTKHRPALPLYTAQDAALSLDAFETIPYGKPFEVAGLEMSFTRAGHMLGSAYVHVRAKHTDILFSGDLGRPDEPLLLPPEEHEGADYLLVESTYGNRLHAGTDPAEMLAEVVGRTAARGGTVIIPAFAVGRAQTILFYLHQLAREKRIPDIPVFIDSPMAGQASTVYARYAHETQLGRDLCKTICDFAEPVETVEESKAIDRMKVPRIIISASGMATGGRVVHHLKMLAPDERNTILFAGYQAAGTRGAHMVAGAKRVKIHGEYVPIRAEVVTLDNVSAHADYSEILAWMKRFRKQPRRTFLVHGEPEAADALRLKIGEELGWSAEVPDYRETVELSGSAPSREPLATPAMRG